MYQSLDDIAELAETLGDYYLVSGKVNLEEIARSESIRFINGDYNDYFIGQLVHYSNRFYIILNNDLLAKTEIGRYRFTIAHELGHYFIDEHRSKLARGISLAFKEDSNHTECKKLETEANHFAANILMPRKRFIKQSAKFEFGFGGICPLSQMFDTSIECTTNHYVNLDLSASIMIKWNADFTFQYARCSTSFVSLTGLPKYPVPIRFESDYFRKQIEIIDQNELDFIESATQISRWISTILRGTEKDILGLEQTVKLGDFGGITLITFHQ